MSRDEAGTRFQDGMRVATEHMRHLQQASIDRARVLRETIGVGKVCFGLKVEVEAGTRLTVSPGLALDDFGRPVVVDSSQSVAVTDVKTLLVAAYDLRGSLLIDGVPTLLANGAKIEGRSVPPPYDDGAVPFAEVTRDGSLVRVLQKGDWYLPPLGHRHSGGFFTDAGGRWRYDGAPLGASSTPQFDSGFVPVGVGQRVRIVHGLKSTELAVELAARGDDRVITNRGIGTDFWFELASDEEIVLARASAEAAAPLALRARAWLLGASSTDLVRPIADAGEDLAVERAAAFRLDATRSRALRDRRLVRFIWTQLT